MAKTHEFTNALRTIVNSAETLAGKKDTNLILSTHRIMLNAEGDLKEHLCAFGMDIARIKHMTIQRNDSIKEFVRESSKKIIGNNTILLEVGKVEVSELIRLADLQSKDVNDRFFTSMVRPNKSATEKVLDAFDTVMKERGIAPIGQVQGRSL